MFEDTKSKVFWFAIGLVAAGLFTAVAVTVLAEHQEFFVNVMKRTESY